MTNKPELDTYQKFVKLLQFVKEIASNNYQDNIYDVDAKKLLEEIGEE